MSYWVGKSREELSEILRTKVFPKNSKSPDHTGPKTGARPVGRPNKDSSLSHTLKIQAYQNDLIARGLCEKGCGNKTKINPKTGNNYRRCVSCKAIQAIEDKRRKEEKKSRAA